MSTDITPPAHSLSILVGRVITGVLVASAMVSTLLLVFSYFGDPGTIDDGITIERQADWLDYAHDGHRVGGEDSPATLVYFSDFQCPACRLFSARLAETRSNFPELTAVYRHWPLRKHPYSFQTALASECAAEQERFVAMHDFFFRRPDLIGTRPWRELADSSGVPALDTFDHCMQSDSSRVAAVVRRDIADARRLGGAGTPTVLVNGVRFVGSPRQHVLDSIVRAAISTAR